MTHRPLFLFKMGGEVIFPILFLLPLSSLPDMLYFIFKLMYTYFLNIYIYIYSCFIILLL